MQRRLKANAARTLGQALGALLGLAWLTPGAAVAEDFDWRNIGGVNFMTPVKSQGSGFTCWSFSTVGALEAKYRITRDDPTFTLTLSEQQLACAGGIGDATTGGYPNLAMDYVTSTGLVTDTELPYTASNTSPLWPLQSGWQNRVVKTTANVNFIPTATATVKARLKQFGPLVSLMDSVNDWNANSPLNNADHAIVIVGFHDDAALPGGGYWIVKNSWGSWWNGNGYGTVPYGNLERHNEINEFNGGAFYTGAMGTNTWDTSAAGGFQGGGGLWSAGASSWSSDGLTLGGWRNGENAAVFAAGGGSNAITVDNNVSAHALIFSAGATGYVLSGGSMILTGGGITANEAVTVNSPITIGAIQTWTVAASATLTVGGPVNLHINALTIAGAGTTAISGAIRDVTTDPTLSFMAPGGGLTLNGPGTLILSGANTYTGGTIINGGVLQIGDGATSGWVAGNITNNGGLTFSRSDTVTFGGAINGSGNLMQSGWGTLVLSGSNTLGGTVGVNAGALQITGTLVNSSNAYVGWGPNVTGAATVSGASAKWRAAAGALYIGCYGDGALNVTNGGTMITTNVNAYVGWDTNSNGAANISGAGSTWSAKGTYLGYYGDGQLNLSAAGIVTNSTNVYVGWGAGSIGSVAVTGAGSKWRTTGGPAYVGYMGSGTLSITNGGAVTNSTNVYLGWGTNSVGAGGVSDAGSAWTSLGYLCVGNYGSGTLNVTSGGSVTNYTRAYLGALTNSSGTATVGGTGSVWRINLGAFFAGVYGTGNLNIAQGGQVIQTGTNAFLGYYPGSTGTVALADAGSGWTVPGSVYVGGSDTNTGGTGLLTVGSGSTAAVGGSVTLWSTGTLGLQGGQVNAASVQVKGGQINGWGTLAAPVNFQGGTVNATDPNNALVLNGALTNGAGQTLSKTGPGTLVIAGTQNHATVASFYARGGMTQINSDAGGSGGATPNLSIHTTNAGTALAFGATQHLALLDVGAGTTVLLDTNGGRVIVTQSLSLAGPSGSPTATLNLHDNDLIVKTGDLNTVRAAILAGRNGGAWDGQGIVTDMAAAIPGKSTALAYAAGNDPNISGLGGKLDGQSFGAGAVVVKYTYAGDANMDGSVDGLDIATWAASFTGSLGLSPNDPSAMAWTQGDWNGDGSVDGLDAAIWAGNFTGSLGAGGLGNLAVDVSGITNPAGVAALEGMGVTVVPEPGTLALLLLAGLPLLGRRRR